MRFFLDTEFTERGNQFPVTLISVGLVHESGNSFYAVSSDFHEEDCNDWVKANVLPHLGDAMRISVPEIGRRVYDWVTGLSGAEKPVFWGYYCDYDWVVFAQMYGTMVDLPKKWPMMCCDIKQLCDSLGNPELPKQRETEHNALADARWNKQAYEFLTAPGRK